MPTVEKDIQNALIGIISGLKHAMRFTMHQENIPLSPLYYLMLKLVHDKERCTAVSIAQSCGRDKGQITRLINELEKQNLVKRIPNPEDKRSNLIELTEAGLACYETLEHADVETLKVMTEDFTPEQLEMFCNMAQAMSEKLEAQGFSKR